MEHHDAVSHAVCLRNVVRHHDDASTPITQSHQFLLDGLNVEPTEVRSALIEEQKRWRKRELSSEHQSLSFTARQIHRGLFSHLSQLEYIAVTLATRW